MIEVPLRLTGHQHFTDRCRFRMLTVQHTMVDLIYARALNLNGWFIRQR